MFWSKGKHLAYNSTSLSRIQSVMQKIGEDTHPSITSIPQCVCAHPINSMGIHLLRCAHGNERIGTHDAIHNTFVTIV